MMQQNGAMGVSVGSEQGRCSSLSAREEVQVKLGGSRQKMFFFGERSKQTTCKREVLSQE